MDLRERYQGAVESRCVERHFGLRLDQQVHKHIMSTSESVGELIER